MGKKEGGLFSFWARRIVRGIEDNPMAFLIPIIGPLTVEDEEVAQDFALIHTLLLGGATVSLWMLDQKVKIVDMEGLWQGLGILALGSYALVLYKRYKMNR